MATSPRVAIPKDLDPASKLRLLQKHRRASDLRHRVTLLDWRARPGYWRCDRDGCDGSPHGRWVVSHARRIPGRSQVAPETPWRVRYLQGGRGSGKGYGASNTFADLILDSEPGEWACVSPTFGDARDVQMTGPSGLIAALGGKAGPGGLLLDRGPWLRQWNVGVGHLHLNNGSVVYCDGAEDGALRIQGRNLRGAWLDEIGLWPAGNPKAKVPMWSVAYDESIGYAVRLEPARIVVSGTPKANRSARALVKRLITDPAIPVDRLHTADNAANLAGSILEEWLQHEGTRHGRQELYGELLDDVEGALVTWDDIVPHRVTWETLPTMRRVLVSVDPSFSGADNADECGIVAVGEGDDHHAYVMEDRSGRMTIDRWSKVAVRLAWDVSANGIVYESNMAGEVVRAHLLGAINDLSSSEAAWVDLGGRPAGWHAPRLIARQARLPKEGRLEVVAPLYQQGRVHHVGQLDALEQQITSWTSEDGYSPDRMDACSAGLAELGVNRPGRRRRTLMGDALDQANA